MIREATLADVPTLVEMGERFIHETGYLFYITANPTQMAHLATNLITKPESTILVMERDGEVTGMLGLCVFAHPLSGERTASEVFWWMNLNARGTGIWLLKRAEQWAKDQGATVLHMIAPTDDVKELYRRLAYAEVETLYQRRLAS